MECFRRQIIHGVRSAKSTGVPTANARKNEAKRSHEVSRDFANTGAVVAVSGERVAAVLFHRLHQSDHVELVVGVADELAAEPGDDAGLAVPHDRRAKIPDRRVLRQREPTNGLHIVVRFDPGAVDFMFAALVLSGCGIDVG